MNCAGASGASPVDISDAIGTDPCYLIVQSLAPAPTNDNPAADDVGVAACTLADVACCSQHWRALCTEPLRLYRERLYRERVSRLSHRLMPLATSALGSRSLTKALGTLSLTERQLLLDLQEEPAPLLGLQTVEARAASWVLLRLSIFCPSALTDLT